MIEVLTLDDRVCELHFKEEDILRYFEVDVQGVVNKIPLLCRSRLKDGAVPTYGPVRVISFFVIEPHVMIIAILILDHPNLKSYPEVVVEEPQIERQIKDGFVYEKRVLPISVKSDPDSMKYKLAKGKNGEIVLMADLCTLQRAYTAIKPEFDCHFEEF